MNRKIFVSYRRDDDGAYFVPVLNQRLTSRYGEESVFYDIDNIPLGVDFRSHLSDAISTSSVVLVVIGDRWMGYDAQTGLRRIDREDDFVRIEVEAALTRNIPVVPVLVGKAVMPCESELPPSISKLAFRNAAEVRTGKDYGLHFDALEKGLDAIFLQQYSTKPIVVDQAAPIKLVGRSIEARSLRNPEAPQLNDERKSLAQTEFTVGAMHINHGIFIPGVALDSHFGGHGEVIRIQYGSSVEIQETKVDRKSNSNQSCRLNLGAKFKKWLNEHSAHSQTCYFSIYDQSPLLVQFSTGEDK